MKYIFIFLFSVSSFSQNIKYNFDYLLEYEVTYHLESKSKIHYLLTNSKDNSYFAQLIEIDSSTFELTFKHHDVIHSKVKVNRNDFSKAEFIDLECGNITSLQNIYKYQTKNYDFHLLNDTIINDVEYFYYKLESNRSLKKRIRKKIGTNYYIIDKSTSFHLPILKHPTAYEEWKLNKFLPNGILHELVFINSLKQRHSSEKLKSFHKTDKKIIIHKKCLEPIKVTIPR